MSATGGSPRDKRTGSRSRRAFLGAATLGGAAAAVGQLTAPTVASAAGLTASGAEVGYAETTMSVSTTSSRTVPGLVLAVSGSDGPVSVEFGGYVASSAASGLVKLYLLRDGRPVQEIGCTVAGPSGFDHLHGQHRLASGQPVSTYTLLLASWTPNATAHIFAGPLSPAFLQARRR